MDNDDGEPRKHERYLEKLSLIGGVDPYSIAVEDMVAITAATSYPNIQYHDIYHYLINSPSPYSGADLKAYKSLDAYNFVINGWVRNILTKQTAEDIFTTTASVSS